MQHAHKVVNLGVPVDVKTALFTELVQSLEWSDSDMMLFGGVLLKVCPCKILFCRDSAPELLRPECVKGWACLGFDRFKTQVPSLEGNYGSRLPCFLERCLIKGILNEGSSRSKDSCGNSRPWQIVLPGCRNRKASDTATHQAW